jgi:hypothetical protein
MSLVVISIDLIMALSISRRTAVGISLGGADRAFIPMGSEIQACHAEVAGGSLDWST